jgi:hypothetical protein
MVGWRRAVVGDLPRLDPDTAASCPPVSMESILRYLHDEAAPEEPMKTTSGLFERRES